MAVADRSPVSRILHAAWVVARRDFVAVIFSKTFLFFLFGPLFPIAVGALAGGIGAQVQNSMDRPTIGVALSAPEAQALAQAREALAPTMRLPALVVLDGTTPEAALANRDRPLVAVLEGTLDAPRLIGPEAQISRWSGPVALLAAQARDGVRAPPVPVETRVVKTSSGNEAQGRVATAQAAQTILFLLMMLLAGMVLSNMVEEKGNKIIEVLAAAIPMDALFLGKLFAMLAVSLVGIGVWFGVGGALVFAGGPVLPDLPVPAVGWPLFLLLGFLYFAMGYLLIGSLFLSIGSLASTVREVQTLSMPVTMMQLLVFFFASFTVTQQGRPLELAAIAFPLSSPFAMMARAAQQETLWPHVLALVWQALCVALIIRLGARIFRRSVLKSGPATGKAQRRSLLARLRSRPAPTPVDTRVGLAG